MHADNNYWVPFTHAPKQVQNVLDTLATALERILVGPTHPLGHFPISIIVIPPLDNDSASSRAEQAPSPNTPRSMCDQ